MAGVKRFKSLKDRLSVGQYRRRTRRQQLRHQRNLEAQARLIKQLNGENDGF